ncbi:MAG: SH3 domain-containing protein, partial [Clostridia bacterium]|nr:SH3 domain-containing protein [Clostridia bacterium]
VSRLWQYEKKIPLRPAHTSSGGGRVFGARTVWVSNGDGTHTKYTLGRKGITKPCETELKELEDGTSVFYCPLCHYSYAVIMIGGKPYNAELVARTTEWEPNKDGTHSRKVWILDADSKRGFRIITETEACSGGKVDAYHGAHCDECHWYYKYAGHNVEFIESVDSSCGYELQTWYCHDCGIEFYDEVETGEPCSHYTITAVTQYPSSVYYSYNCPVCGQNPCYECELDPNTPEKYGCTHYGLGGTMLSMSGECGDLYKTILCAGCGETYTLIDRTNLNGCPEPHDVGLGYLAYNQFAEGCGRCGKIWNIIYMSEEEAYACSPEFCPERGELPGTHEFVRDDEKCYEDCFAKHEFWHCKFCGYEDYFTEEGGAHTSTDTLLTDTCALKEWGCPSCGQVFKTEEGDECQTKDVFLGFNYYNEETVETTMRFGCPECGKVWKEVKRVDVGSMLAGEEEYVETVTEPCTAAEGHNWVTEDEMIFHYCTHTEEEQICTNCFKTRWRVVMTGKDHPRTDKLMYATCEKEWFGCPECCALLSSRETGKQCTKDALLETWTKTVDGKLLTCYTLGCPVCGEYYSSFSEEYIPENEWSEWEYMGDGSHSRYWKENTAVVQHRSCVRSADDPTKCAVCGSMYIEHGIALATYAITIYSAEGETVGEIPAGAYYEILENGERPYVRYNGIEGHIGQNDVRGLRYEQPCADPAGHDWYTDPENYPPFESCTEIRTTYLCSRCLAQKSGIQTTGKQHPQTDAVLFERCSTQYLGCPECGKLIDERATGRDCEVKDALLELIIDEEEGYKVAALGCPVCGVEYDYIELDRVAADDWTEWVSNSNGTHSRHMISRPTVVDTENCLPADAAEKYCACCGAAYLNRGTCTALESIELYTDAGSTDVICVIPEGATYYVLSNGDYAKVEYNGQTGYIAGKYLNFTDEEI